AAAEKLIVPEVGEENVDGGGPAVHRDQVLQVNRLLCQFIPERLQGRVRRINVGDEESVFPGHAGDDVRDVGEAKDVLHLRNFFDLVGQALNLLQHPRRVDVVGDHAGHADFVAAEQVADLVVVGLFRIVPRQQAVYRAVQADVPRVVGKKAGEHKDEKEDSFGPVNDQIRDPLHNWLALSFPGFTREDAK